MRLVAPKMTSRNRQKPAEQGDGKSSERPSPKYQCMDLCVSVVKVGELGRDVGVDTIVVGTVCVTSDPVTSVYNKGGRSTNTCKFCKSEIRKICGHK